MANKRSAIKRMRQIKKRTVRNSAAKTAVKTAFRRAESAIAAKSKDAQPLVRNAASVMDKAVERGLLHRNNAARKKSRLLKKYNLAFKK